MNTAILLVMGLLAFERPSESTDPAHSQNSLYSEFLNSKLDLDGLRVALPAPSFRDDQTAAEQEAELRSIAGSERARGEFLRDSVTAPFILKVNDLTADDQVVRQADLWFVVRGDLADLDLGAVANEAGEQGIEVANMRFDTRMLTDADLKPFGVSRLETPNLRRWFVHIEGRLLDRIQFGVTDEIVVSRSDTSVVVAARTSPAFSKSGPLGNFWNTIDRDGKSGEQRVYSGGASYARIARLVEPKGALVVELHAAFSEPKPWFRGAPILRSKFGLIAQDRVRSLRREIASHSKPD
jgi:hypothetical protein